ncbi:hypothetical protein D3C74_318090 [compost metagenome]
MPAVFLVQVAYKARVFLRQSFYDITKALFLFGRHLLLRVEIVVFFFERVNLVDVLNLRRHVRELFPFHRGQRRDRVVDCVFHFAGFGGRVIERIVTHVVKLLVDLLKRVTDV